MIEQFPWPIRVVYVGDSFTNAWGVGANSGFPAKTPLVGRRLAFGVDGRRLSQMGPAIATMSGAYPYATLVLQGSWNDFLAGASGEDAFGLIESLAYAGLAAGFARIVALTQLDAAFGQYLGPYTGIVNTFNGLLIGSSGGPITAVANVAAVDVSRTNDGVHPDVNGHVTIGNVVGLTLLGCGA